MNDTELYMQAVAQWGAEAQLLMVCEEVAELTVALHHYLRGRGDMGDIAEEVADVEFMLDQLKAIFDLADAPRSDFSALVQEWRTTKRMKLEAMLNLPKEARQ